MTTRKFIRQVVTIYVVIPVVVVLALLYIASRAVAHHNPDHRVLVIGEETKVIVRMSSCDTPEQVKELIDMAKNGLEAFRALYSTYVNTPNERGEPICGIVTDVLYPIELLYVAELGGHKVWVFRFMDSEGDIYIGFSGVPVVRPGQDT